MFLCLEVAEFFKTGECRRCCYIKEEDVAAREDRQEVVTHDLLMARRSLQAR